MIRSILVPLDGSPLAEHALPFALSIARQSGAVVHVAFVHVPEAYVERSALYADGLDWEPKAHEQAYLDALGARLGRAFDGKFELRHLEGIVEETLAEEVVERHVDLVVMNAHGWGYISRALVGSVSDYLIRHVTVPVLMMHTEGVRAALDRAVSFRRVLIPLDGTELAETIVEPATDLGRLWQAEYHLLQVIPWARPLSAAAREHPFAIPRSVQDENVAAAEDYLRSVRDRLAGQSLAADTQVAVNRNVTAAVLQEASTDGCDLIAISTHGRTGLSRLLLGSVADKVVRGAHTPVLVYRPALET